MSPFIDSMTDGEETAFLQQHLVDCETCRWQMQSYVSVTNCLRRSESRRPPEDLGLEIRVRLSQVRSGRRPLARLETRLANMLRPVAVPAASGVALTLLLFVVVLVGLLPVSTALANSASDDAGIGVYRPVRTTEPTMIRFAGTRNRSIDEPLMIETNIGQDGRVVDFRIISGPDTPEIDRWLKELLYFAEFSPATSFGRPVDSKIVLSFVAVRSQL